MSNWIRSPFQLMHFRKENQALKLPALHMTAHDKAVIEKAAELLKDALTKQGSVHIMHHTGENTMQNKQALQPFDLEKALAGHPVVTRDGRSVEVVGSSKRQYREVVVFFIEGYEDVCSADSSGQSLCGYSNRDLFMAPRMHTVWIAQWKGGSLAAFHSEGEAVKFTKGDAVSIYPVEIPEHD